MNQDVIGKVKELDGVRKKLASAENDLAVKEKINVEYREEVSKLQGLLEEANLEMERMQGEVDSLQKEAVEEKGIFLKVTKDYENKAEEVRRLEGNIELLKTKHRIELEEKAGKWQLFQEHNKSLQYQLDNYKKRELKLHGNAQQMQKEVGLITEELRRARVILNDFKTALTDKDNDLKKINDAVVLLERSYAMRQAEVQKKLRQVKEEFEHATDEVQMCSEKLLARDKEIEMLKTAHDEYRANYHAEKHENMNLEDIVRRLEGLLVEKDKLMKLRDDQLQRKGEEVSKLKTNLATEGREVEGLINKLEATLRDVKLQLDNVENEKQGLRDAIEKRDEKVSQLEETLRGLKEELQAKKEDLELEKLRKEDLKKKLRRNQRL